MAHTLGRDNSIPCSGQITGTVQTPHDRPGIALVTLSWTPFFTSPCAITAYVNFWNTDTHQGGTMLAITAYVNFWNTDTHQGGTMLANLTNESSGLATPRGDWTQQISIPIGSGPAGLTVTTEAFSTGNFDPNRVMTRFVVA